MTLVSFTVWLLAAWSSKSEKYPSSKAGARENELSKLVWWLVVFLQVRIIIESNDKIISWFEGFSTWRINRNQKQEMHNYKY